MGMELHSAGLCGAWFASCKAGLRRPETSPPTAIQGSASTLDGSTGSGTLGGTDASGGSVQERPRPNKVRSTTVGPVASSSAAAAAVPPRRSITWAPPLQGEARPKPPPPVLVRPKQPPIELLLKAARGGGPAAPTTMANLPAASGGAASGGPVQDDVAQLRAEVESLRRQVRAQARD